MKPSTKYVKTATQLAEILGISRQELQGKWMKNPDWPAKTAKGWDTAACADFRHETNRRTIETTAGINSDVKRRKLLAEAEKAEIDVQERLGRLIDQDAHIQAMIVQADIYKSAWVEFSQWFTALHPEPEVVKKLLDLENKARAKIRAMIDERDYAKK
jgi:hypothetical protein